MKALSKEASPIVQVEEIVKISQFKSYQMTRQPAFPVNMIRQSFMLTAEVLYRWFNDFSSRRNIKKGDE